MQIEAGALTTKLPVLAVEAAIGPHLASGYRPQTATGYAHTVVQTRTRAELEAVSPAGPRRPETYVVGYIPQQHAAARYHCSCC